MIGFVSRVLYDTEMLPRAFDANVFPRHRKPLLDDNGKPTSSPKKQTVTEPDGTFGTIF